MTDATAGIENGARHHRGGNGPILDPKRCRQRIAIRTGSETDLPAGTVAAAAERSDLADIQQHVVEAARLQKIGDAVGHIPLGDTVQRHRHARAGKVHRPLVEDHLVETDQRQPVGKLRRGQRIAPPAGVVGGVSGKQRLNRGVEQPLRFTMRSARQRQQAEKIGFRGIEATAGVQARQGTVGAIEAEERLEAGDLLLHRCEGGFGLRRIRADELDSGVGAKRRARPAANRRRGESRRNEGRRCKRGANADKAAPTNRAGEEICHDGPHICMSE